MTETIEPVIVSRLEDQAKADSTNGHTGYAVAGGVCVRYYPGCGRYAWFGEEGLITRRTAIARLRAARQT